MHLQVPNRIYDVPGARLPTNHWGFSSGRVSVDPVEGSAAPDPLLDTVQLQTLFLENNVKFLIEDYSLVDILLFSYHMVTANALFSNILILKAQIGVAPKYL